MKKYTLLSLLFVFFYGCVKDKPSAIIQPQIQLTNAKKVYVVNEGPFQTGNASITLYDATKDEVVENYYKVQNNSEIGNVAQSLSNINGNFYIVVNNSNKIIVCDNNFKKIAQITGLISPRYILPVTNQKAYVSDLYANAISVVDLSSNTKIGSIACKGKTEKMVLIYNKAFVTNTESNYVYIINTITDTKSDSVFVGKNASSIVIDKNDKIWVLNSGESPSLNGKLTKLNPVSNQVEVSLTFATNESPHNLCLNKSKDTLYFLNNGIFRFSIVESALPLSPFIASGNKNFYGLGLNPNDFTIYAADALDYIQKSNIYIFDAKGIQKNVFKAGIISNGFYFE